MRIALRFGPNTAEQRESRRVGRHNRKKLNGLDAIAVARPLRAHHNRSARCTTRQQSALRADSQDRVARSAIGSISTPAIDRSQRDRAAVRVRSSRRAVEPAKTHKSNSARQHERACRSCGFGRTVSLESPDCSKWVRAGGTRTNRHARLPVATRAAHALGCGRRYPAHCCDRLLVHRAHHNMNARSHSVSQSRRRRRACKSGCCPARPRCLPAPLQARSRGV